MSKLSRRFSPYSRIFKSKSLESISEDVIETDKIMTEPREVFMQPSTGGTYNDIFNSLRIPDAIKDLPRFDGNPRLLHEFINNVEEILLHIRGADGTPYGQILLRAVRNKITEQANEVLNMYGTALNWDDIKGNLILHYSDKRTETSLIRDLHGIRQDGKTVEAFYSQVMEIQSALYNNIMIHETDQNVITAKKELFAGMCLNSFMTNLREPLGASIRAMRPESLATALSFCIKEQNIFYGQVRNRQTFDQRTKFQPYPNYGNARSGYGQSFGNTFSRPRQSSQFSGPRPNFNPGNSPFKYQRPPFNTSSYVNRGSGSSQSRTEPMETSTAFSRFGKPNNPFKQSPSGRTHISSNSRMELNNMDDHSTVGGLNSDERSAESDNFQDNDIVENFQDLDRYQDEATNIVDELNFRVPASRNRRGT